jgi:hypothetical protein
MDRCGTPERVFDLFTAFGSEYAEILCIRGDAGDGHKKEKEKKRKMSRRKDFARLWKPVCVYACVKSVSDATLPEDEIGCGMPRVCVHDSRKSCKGDRKQ